MLAERNPQAVYRRVELDARVQGADPQQLLALCYEQLISALGSARFAHDKGDNRMKSEALTRAVSALTALHFGVTGEGGVADALRHLYTSARKSVLDSVLAFDADTLERIRGDFIDISRALTPTRAN
ncbi:MAG: flagellar protein FliS [Sphingomonadales bacterium]|nr:flagellar protein FliS [Sphingomonadales bacterium]